MAFYKNYFFTGVVLLLTIACASGEQRMPMSNSYKLEFMSQDDSRTYGFETPIHLNTKPNKVYEIIVKFKNLSYPIQPIEKVFATFDALNCEYHYGITGVSYIPTTSIYMPNPIKINNNTYKYIFVRDTVSEKDLKLEDQGKKLGVCHWQLDERGMHAYFSPTGKWTEKVVSVDMIPNEEMLDNITSDKPILDRTYYYSKDFLSSEPVQVYPDGKGWYRMMLSDITRGYADSPPHDVKKDKLFSVQISIKKL